MKPKGKTRTLILYIGDIQDLIGMAWGASMNDRDAMQADHIQTALKKAHELCIEARSMYDPITRIAPQKGSEDE